MSGRDRQNGRGSQFTAGLSHAHFTISGKYVIYIDKKAKV